MRLLLANPNTSAAVTELILAEARRVASPGTTVIGRNGSFGAEVIGTRRDAAVGGHALIDLLAAHAGDADAVVIGMSLDIGLWAAREMLSVPVIGMTEAACLMASTLAPRFGLVTLGARNAEPLRELMAGYGLLGRVAAIRAVAAVPQDLLHEPEAVHGPILDGAAACAEAGAGAVVLVGAVMAGLPRLLQPRAAVPLVEGIGIAVMLAESRVRLARLADKAT